MKLFKEMRERAERRLRLEELKEANRHREKMRELDLEEYKNRAQALYIVMRNRGLVDYVETGDKTYFDKTAEEKRS